MKKIYTALALVLTLMGATSCNDFLDVRPKGEKVEGDLFSTAKGFEEAIYGVYGSMAAESLYGRDLVWGIPDVLSQDLKCTSTTMSALAKYDYESDDNLRSRFKAMWTDAYKTIGYANNVLQNLDKTDLDLPLHDSYRGEMLAVRAMVHFDLLRMFAPTDESKRGIPYVEAYSFSVKPFLTVGECYGKIIADLTEAERLLAADENIMTWPRDNARYLKFENWRETHLNIHAVRALLARLYWYRGDMTKAADYATKVADAVCFPLVDVTEVQSHVAGVLCPKETIFGLYSPKYLDTSISLLYNFVSFKSYDPYTSDANESMLSWEKLFQLDIPATSQDFRRTHFVVSNSVARCLKMVDYQAMENGGNSSRPELIAGVPLIGVSEMYIIAADALLDSDPDRALLYYNRETGSRGLTSVSAAEGLTHERISNEFHKELYCQGQQWFNMKRTYADIMSNFEGRTIPGSESIYVVPVPAEEFEYRPE